MGYKQTEFEIVKVTDETTQAVKYYVYTCDGKGRNIRYLQRNGTLNIANLDGWFDDYAQIGLAMMKHNLEIAAEAV